MTHLEIFDSLLIWIGLTPELVILPMEAEELKNRRRDFRGTNRRRPTINVKFAFSWVSEYNSKIANMTGVCESMVSEYESRVNVFGYSLRHLTLILPLSSAMLSKIGQYTLIR